MILGRGPGGYFIGGVACLGLAGYALVTGEMPTKSSAILRTTAPKEFWLFVLLTLGFGVGCFWWALRLLGRPPE